MTTMNNSPVYINFDPVQVTVLHDDKGESVLQFYYYDQVMYSGSERTHKVCLEQHTIHQLIEFLETLALRGYRDRFEFTQEGLVLKFNKHRNSNIGSLNIIKGKLCKRRFGFDIPITPVRPTIMSLELLLSTLKINLQPTSSRI